MIPIQKNSVNSYLQLVHRLRYPHSRTERSEITTTKYPKEEVEKGARLRFVGGVYVCAQINLFLSFLFLRPRAAMHHARNLRNIRTYIT